MSRIPTVQHQTNPRQRIWLSLLLWLGVAIILLWLFQYQQHPKTADLLYPQAAHDHSHTEQLDGLGYLNHIRQQAGLPILHYSSKLAAAAGNHARYLTQYPNDGHHEHHRNSPHFTGTNLSDRIAHVGYAYQGAQENISTIQNGQGSPLPYPLPEHLHLDGLLTAIYHRFSLLDPTIDEAGIVMAASPQHQVLVVNQGNRTHQALCRLRRQQPQIARTYMIGLCHGNSLIYQDEIKQTTQPSYIVYPVGNLARTNFYNEIPNPMPHHEFTGNPISIMFTQAAAPIKMHSFHLYQANTNQEIQPTHLLNQQTDPNQLLTPHQFALFPLAPLQYDTPYRAEFHYQQNNQNHTIIWQFRTKKPDYPYFIVHGGEKLAIKSQEAYFIQWQNKACRSQCTNVHYRTQHGAELTLHGHEIDGLILSVKGERGSSVHIMRGQHNDQAVTLYIQ